MTWVRLPRLIGQPRQYSRKLVEVLQQGPQSQDLGESLAQASLQLYCLEPDVQAVLQARYPIPVPAQPLPESLVPVEAPLVGSHRLKLVPPGVAAWGLPTWEAPPFGDPGDQGELALVASRETRPFWHPMWSLLPKGLLTWKIWRGLPLTHAQFVEMCW